MMKYWSLWWCQVCGLSAKFNSQIYAKKISTLRILIFPLLGVILISFIHALMDKNKGPVTRLQWHQEAMRLGPQEMNIENTLYRKPAILYSATLSTPFDIVDEVMHQICKDQNMKFIQESPDESVSEWEGLVIRYENSTHPLEQLLSHFVTQRGKKIVLIAVLFHMVETSNGIALEVNFVDPLLDDFSTKRFLVKDFFLWKDGYSVNSPSTIAIQHIIEKAYLHHRHGNQSIPTFDLRYRLQPFERIVEPNDPDSGSFQSQYDRNNLSRIILNNVMLVVISTLSFLPLAFHAYSIVQKEKRLNLLSSLRKSGLLEGAYWTSAFITLLPLQLAITFTGFGSLLLMKLCFSEVWQIEVIMRTDLTIVVLALFAFAVSLTSFFLMLSSLVKRPFLGQIMSGIVVLLMLAMQLVLSLTGSAARPPTESPKEGKYNPTSWDSPFEPGNNLLRMMYFFFPWWSFGKIWFDCLRYTETSDDQKQMFYTFEMMFRKTHILFESPRMNEPIEYDVESTFTSILFLLASSVVFIVLAWYFNQLGDRDTGYSLPLYYVFTRSYWGIESMKIPINETNTLDVIRARSEFAKSLYVHKLSKSYKSVTAVKEFSQEFHRGKVYALLGHNGAGKTSLIKLLSCTVRPTHGVAYLNGFDLEKDRSIVQQRISCCPQDDLLWEDLDAIANIKLIMSMRGVRFPSAAEAKQYIINTLDSVNLNTSKTLGKAVGSFSGGMKRRLSYAISTVEGSENQSELLILDECTTGMDPVNRQKIWRLIEQAKKDKIVILCTHSMEEAENLADEICVMHNGSLKAKGTSIFLKNRYGNGYQLKVKLNSTNSVKTLIEKYVPSSRIEDITEKSITVNVMTNELSKLPELFQAIETQICLPSESQLEWSISNTTLEQVFLKLCSHEMNENDNQPCLLCGKQDTTTVTLFTYSGIPVNVEGLVCRSCGSLPQETDHQLKPVVVPALQNESLRQQTSESSENLNVDCFRLDMKDLCDESAHLLDQSDRISYEPHQVSLMKQVKAILYKNLSLLSKQRKTLIIFVLFICIIIASIISVDEALKQYSIGDRVRCTSGICDFRNLGESFDKKANSGCTARPFECRNTELGFKSYFEMPFTGSTTNEVFWIEKGNSSSNLWSHRRDDCYSCILPPLLEVDNLFESQRSNQFDPLLTNTDVCGETGSRKFALGVPFRDQERSNNYFMSHMPLSGINIINDDVEHGVLYADLFYYSDLGSRFSTFTNNTSGCQFIGVDQSFMGVDRGVSSMTSSLSNFALRQGSNSSGESIRFAPISLYDFGIYVPGQYFFAQFLVDIVIPCISVLMIMLASFTLFPSFVLLMHSEKNDRLFSYMCLHGMSPTAYWLGNALHHLVCFTVSIAFVIILGFAIPLRVFSHVSILDLLVIVIAWYYAQLGLAIFLSAVVDSPFRTSIVFSFMSSLLSFGLIFYHTMNEQIMSEWWSIFPPIAFGHLLFGSFRGIYEHFYFDTFVGLLLCGSVLLLTGIYLHGMRAAKPASGSSVENTSENVPHFLNVLPKQVRTLLQKMVRKLPIMRGPYVLLNERPDDNRIDTSEIDPASISELEAEDEVARESRIADESIADEYAVCIRHLSKSFSNPNHPVQPVLEDISLAIPYGELFTILGPNGAGKTTLLSVLMGLLHPSSGSAEIGGRSVTDHRHLYARIGVCSQNDVIWPDMTVQEHLYFIARLRGCPPSTERTWVQCAAELVQLDGDAFKRRASQLSGGMRRRLSLAMALIGDRPILYLDEISTGLDPDSRHQMWSVIQQIKRKGNHCILLTTHSMEEADALSDRIGILAKGKIRCLGSPDYLKNRYGQQFRLVLRLQLSFKSVDADQLGSNSHRLGKLLKPFEDQVVHILDSELKGDIDSELIPISSQETFVNRSGISVVRDKDDHSIFEWRITRIYVLPLSARGRIADVLARMEACVSRSNSGETCFKIVEWALNPTTIEDVFMRVAGFSI